MVKVKICGITNYEDAINAARLGADYLGFNFYKGSPRYIHESKAKRIIEGLPKNVKTVGIFVNEDTSKIIRAAESCNIDLIQLSGDEDAPAISKLRKATNKKIIKVFRVKNKEDIKNILDFKKSFPSKDFFVLLDSFKKGDYGGTGTMFDWGIVSIAKGFNKKRLFLSGGLKPANVKQAICKVKPYAVDVCSGVEKSPGKKDSKKVREFIKICKN